MSKFLLQNFNGLSVRCAHDVEAALQAFHLHAVGVIYGSHFRVGLYRADGSLAVRVGAEDEGIVVARVGILLCEAAPVGEDVCVKLAVVNLAVSCDVCAV